LVALPVAFEIGLKIENDIEVSKSMAIESSSRRRNQQKIEAELEKGCECVVFMPWAPAVRFQ
jgi:hypothetical protein